MAVDRTVNLHRHRQHAAAQASHFLHRELALRIGILARYDPQLAAEGLVGTFRALHMTGRADTHLDAVAADRAEAELSVKRGDPGHLGLAHAEPFRHGGERVGRQIAVLVLNRLQQGDQMVAPAFHAARKLVYSVSGHAADLTIVGQMLSRRFRARDAVEKWRVDCSRA